MANINIDIQTLGRFNRLRKLETPTEFLNKLIDEYTKEPEPIVIPEPVEPKITRKKKVNNG